MGTTFVCPCTSRKSENEKLIKYQSRNASPTKRILTDQEIEQVQQILLDQQEQNLEQLRRNQSLKVNRIRLSGGESNIENLLNDQFYEEIRAKTVNKQKKYLNQNLSSIEEDFLKIMFFHPKEQFLYSFMVYYIVKNKVFKKGKMLPTAIVPYFSNPAAKIVVYQSESVVSHLSFNITSFQNYNEIIYDTSKQGLNIENFVKVIEQFCKQLFIYIFQQD